MQDIVPYKLVHRQLGPTYGIFISLLEVAYARILDIRLACLLRRRCDRRSSVVSAVGVFLARLLDKECPPLTPPSFLSTSGASLDPRRTHCGDVRRGIGSVCELSPRRPSSSPAGNFLHSSVVVSWCCDIVSAYNRCVCSKPLRWRSGTSAPRIPSSSLELVLGNPAYSQELFFISLSVIA